MRSMNMKAAIIGLDGVPIELVKDLTSRGVMPGLRDILKEGELRKLQSTVPPNSAASWTSMTTGKNPGEHGVYGFTDFVPGTLSVRYHYASRLKAQPFWARNPALRTLVVNLPASYPAQPLNGVHISGFVSPCLRGAVYPSSFHDALAKLGYMIDVEAPATPNDYGRFIADLNTSLHRRVEATERHLQRGWDIFFMVLTGTDRIGHYLWEAYRDDNHEHHEAFLDYFRQVDEAIEHLNGLLGEDTPLMMLSDHGMGESRVSLNLNTLLRRSGHLATSGTEENYYSLEPGTKAFASETNKIYLNRVGRFPRGSVTEDAAERITDELNDLLLGTLFRGSRIVKRIYTGGEIYSGPYTDASPDLIVIPEKGFSLKTRLTGDRLFSVDGLTGTHTDD
ncbi:hypothetical protein A3K69_06625, partial [Candidatus Bathyarchaeota archaeon RBG_16_57_9]